MARKKKAPPDGTVPESDLPPEPKKRSARKKAAAPSDMDLTPPERRTRAKRAVPSAATAGASATVVGDVASAAESLADPVEALSAPKGLVEHVEEAESCATPLVANPPVDATGPSPAVARRPPRPSTRREIRARALLRWKRGGTDPLDNWVRGADDVQRIAERAIERYRSGSSDSMANWLGAVADLGL